MSPKDENENAWGWEEYTLLACMGVGLVAFIVVGVVPALVYGGYAALILFSEIIGGPVEPTLAARAFIVVGMVLGVVATGALFATAGALLGLVGVGLGNVGLHIAGIARRAATPTPAGAEKPAEVEAGPPAAEHA